MRGRKKPTNPAADPGGPVFYEVDLTPNQLKALRAFVEGRGAMVNNAMRSQVDAALKHARPMAYELPLASLPWDEVEAEARRQGVSPADVVWDRAGRTSPDGPAS